MEKDAVTFCRRKLDGYWIRGEGKGRAISQSQMSQTFVAMLLEIVGQDQQMAKHSVDAF